MSLVNYIRIVVLSLSTTVLFSNIVAQGYSDTTFNTLLRTENGGWVAGDATYSIALPDGRTLWLFGDSFIGTVNPDSSLVGGAKMIRNCAVLQENDSMIAMYQGTYENPVDFVQTNTPDSTWFWPEHGLVENGNLKIIFSEFGIGDGTPGWNFEYRNACLIIFTYPGLELIGNIPLPYYELNEVMYGDRLMEHEGFTYIYGRREEGNPDWNIPYVHIARAQIGDLLGEWEFFDGNTWSSEPESSVRLTDHPVSQQYGVFPHEGKFILITQEIWLGTTIYSLTAEQVEGPWENLQELYITPHPFEDMFTYNAYPHPQFDEDNALLVSYNSNGSFWEIFNNVELYRPKFIRIPYAMIDSAFVPTGIKEDSGLRFKVNKVYPNPVQDRITFSFALQEPDYIQVHIYNALGTEVMVTQGKWFAVGDAKLECNLFGLPNGIYFYRIKNESGLFIHN